MSDYPLAEPTCPEIDAAILALEGLRFSNSNLRTGVWHYRELYEECKAQLAQRDAALKAADELADASDAATAFVGYSAHVPAIEERLDAAINAYRKARGQADD